MSQQKDELRQCKISEYLPIALSTVNKVIIKFIIKSKKGTNPHPRCPEHSERTLSLVQRNAKRIYVVWSLIKLMSVSEQLYDSTTPQNFTNSTSWATITELQERNHLFLQLVSSAERIELLDGGETCDLLEHCHFFDEFQFTLFFDSEKVWLWKLCSKEFDFKRLKKNSETKGHFCNGEGCNLK